MIIWSLSFIVIIIVIIILSAHKQIASSVKCAREGERARTESRICTQLLAPLMPIYFDCPRILFTFQLDSVWCTSPDHTATAFAMRLMGGSLVALVDTHSFPQITCKSTHSQWHLLYSSNWRWLVNYFTSNTFLMMMMMGVIRMNCFLGVTAHTVC